MNEVEAKYDRFKDFVRTSAPTVSMTLIAFLNVPLDTFLESVYEYSVKEKMTDRKILTLICSKIDINPKDIKADDLEKLLYYTAYFKGVAKIVYS